jgi:sugar phosphate permease
MGRFHPAVVSHWGWHYSWYILGAIALVMVVMNVLFLRSRPEDLGLRPWGDKDHQLQTTASAHSVSIFKKHYREIFRAPKFWVIGVSYALVSGALYLPVTFMVDYAYSTLNLPYGSASLLITVHGICQIPGVLVIPWLSDFIGRRPAILVSDLVLAAGTVSLLLSRADLPLLYLSVGILGALFGVIFVLYGACAGDYFPKELVGSVVGIWTPFYGAGLIIAQWLGGYIRDVTGSFLIPFAGAAACAIVAAGLFLAVKRTSSPADASESQCD